MSLKAFHLVFMIASIFLASYFGYWCISDYGDSENVGMLVLAILSLASALGLSVYLFWFLKKLKNVGFLAFVFFISCEFLQACPVCIGDPNSPMVKGANMGVWFLLVVVGTVLGMFVSLFAYWGIRAKKLSQS